MKKALTPWLWTIIVGLVIPSGSSNEHLFHTNSISEGLAPSCSSLRRQYDEDERLSYAPFPPDISGHWISEKCEIRPGPEFLIRKYEFYKNNTFELIQFFYGESSCSIPLYSVIARGSLDPIGPSWVVPGGFEMDFTLYSVKIIPYSSDVTEELFFRVNSTCTELIQKRHWKPHHQYLIYSYSDDEVEETANSTDFDCLHSIHAVFNEVQLSRVVKKPTRKGAFYSRSSYSMKSYLYLGDIYPIPEGRFAYRPTSYQDPLINYESMAHCQQCIRVARSSVKNPPHLYPAPALALPLTNEWISKECESMPIGTFLRRRYVFNEAPEARNHKKKRMSSTWSAEINYYSDPSCLHPTYTTFLQGTFAIGRESVIQNVRNIDFIVTSTILTPQDQTIVSNLNGHLGNVCGSQSSWTLGASQELAKTNGCTGLGIVLPRRVQSLIRTERDGKDFGLLYLGVSEVSGESLKGKRPTFLHPALVNCRDYSDSEKNEISPMSYAMTSSSCQRCLSVFVLIFPLTYYLL